MNCSRNFSSFVLFASFVVKFIFLSISFGCGFAALGASWWYTSDQLLPKPETLSKAVFNFLTGQRFAKHFVAHVDPLVADFSNRFFHPT